MSSRGAEDCEGIEERWSRGRFKDCDGIRDRTEDPEVKEGEGM
jgi:hypothetical protein